jgi:predicted ArsR family transcriptional regulator
MKNETDKILIKNVEFSLNNQGFVKLLLNHLTGSLQDTVGLSEAEGFISLVGSRMGEQLDSEYRDALQVQKLSKSQLSEVLIDLKARLDGKFYVIEESTDKIVFGNTHCPFGNSVFERPSLCMMTSNVFGVIASENLGYAKVSIDESIANNHDHCRVTVYLNPNEQMNGREYYSTT